MTSLLNRLFGRARQGSGATAKNRLHFVLQHDRINLPPERMEEMKREVLAVIVKYLVVDEDRVEIALEQRDRSHSKLVAEIPFAKEKQAPISLQPESSAAGSDANGAEKSAEVNEAEESRDDGGDVADSTNGDKIEEDEKP